MSKEKRVLTCKRGCGSITMTLTPFELLCVLKEMQCSVCKSGLTI